MFLTRRDPYLIRFVKLLKKSPILEVEGLPTLNFTSCTDKNTWLWKLMYATWKSKWKYFLHTKETRSKLLAVNSCKSSTVRNQKSLFAQGWHARSFSIFNIIIFHKKTSILIFNIKLFEIVISIFSMKQTSFQYYKAIFNISPSATLQYLPSIYALRVAVKLYIYVFPSWDKWSWKIFDNFLSNINSSYFTSSKQHWTCFANIISISLLCIVCEKKKTFPRCPIFPNSKTQRKECFQVFTFQDCKIFASADVTGPSC